MKRFWKILTAVVLVALFAIPAMAATGEELLKSADVYLTFEGEIKDVNGNYSVISEGDTPLVEGKFGQAANCQAAVNYMTVEELTFGTSSFSVSLWVKQNAVSGDPVLFGNKDWMSGSNPGFLLSARTNDWKYNANVPGGSRTDMEYVYSAVPGSEGIDTWNHLVLVVDRDAEKYYFYVNGAKYGMTGDFSNKGHTEVTYDDEDMMYPFNIGEDGTGIINLAQVFDVDYDEFAVFKRALTAEEALAIYQYAPEGYAAAEVAVNPLTAPLTTTADAAAVKAEADLFLSFDEAVKDDMGKYSIVSNGETPLVAGVSGTAANIKSGVNYMTVEDFKFGTDSFTVSTWINIHDPSSDPVILSNKNWESGGNEGIAFSLRGEGQWRFNANVAGGSRWDDHLVMSEVSAITEQFKENWVYVTYVIDRTANTAQAYFNGRAIGDPTNFAENGHTDGVYEDTVNNYPLNIGEDGIGDTVTRYGYTMNIDIDELAIFKKALTADEVAALYLSYEAPAPGTIVEVPVTLTTDKTEYTVGESIMVTATGDGANDWIGLYPVDGTAPGEGGASWYWFYVRESQGTAVDMKNYDGTHAGEDLPAGDYVLYYLYNDGYVVGATANITIKEAAAETEPAVEEPETVAPETEAPAVEEPETVAPETEAPAVETPAEDAPQTFDAGIIAAAAAIVSAAGYALSKKRR